MFNAIKESLKNFFYRVTLPKTSESGVTVGNIFVSKEDIPCWDKEGEHLACYCGKECPVPYMKCVLNDIISNKNGCFRCARSL